MASWLARVWVVLTTPIPWAFWRREAFPETPIPVEAKEELDPPIVGDTAVPQTCHAPTRLPMPVGAFSEEPVAVISPVETTASQIDEVADRIPLRSQSSHPPVGVTLRLRPAIARRDRRTAKALELLQRDIAQFNAWRRGENHAPLWMSGVTLNGRDLRHVEWAGCVLADADLSEADLRGARFANAVLVRARFSGANVENSDFWLQDLSSVGSLPDWCNPELGNHWYRPTVRIEIQKQGRLHFTKKGITSGGLRLRLIGPFGVKVTLTIGDGQTTVVDADLVLEPGVWKKHSFSVAGLAPEAPVHFVLVSGSGPAVEGGYLFWPRSAEKKKPRKGR